ncbi:hypothetical protein L596_021265 [Steinernema carpocapsae]|uniref:Uncharacterized protein n=1 Tax=Steinernema carpocapsae TaxID=34508 RepID=A0A4U5MI29_STECR|nr:hypothetical protein L596_021261 [Steinernema carpocapsae]TKR69064.1 hypothetical protein L596_021265 [Steinernema carpocapsae]
MGNNYFSLLFNTVFTVMEFEATMGHCPNFQRNVTAVVNLDRNYKKHFRIQIFSVYKNDIEFTFTYVR